MFLVVLQWQEVATIVTESRLFSLDTSDCPSSGNQSWP